MKKLLAAVLLVFLIAGNVAADDGYAVQQGDFFVGASIGLNYFSSSPIYGLDCEFILTDEIGMGKIGVGAIARYWKWDVDVFIDTYSYSYTFIGAQGNYHFNFGGPKLDIYAGVVLGYGIFNSDWVSASGSSMLLFAFHAGVRWKISENLFITGRVGAGGTDFGGLEAGVDLRL